MYVCGCFWVLERVSESVREVGTRLMNEKEK